MNLFFAHSCIDVVIIKQYKSYSGAVTPIAQRVMCVGTTFRDIIDSAMNGP